MESQARKFLSEANYLVLVSSTAWIFGEQPTAFDAHLVVFLARMMDVGRLDLIPEALLKYARRATQSREWRELMQDRTTMPLL